MSLIVTDVAVISVERDGLQLTEVAPGWTADDVQEITEAKLVVSPDLGDFWL